MKSLKKKFGKFAISQTKAKNVNGGWRNCDPNDPCCCPPTKLCKPNPNCDWV
ncbi:hypothetical protein [Bernardetia sp.]|uniref:hypothetical protein n=1 Tax=Bernardetia sp. TaxID=1937974 RepID=UPI0025B8B623|nr:hypothetical protein [Bernardetia sp.]